MAHMKSRTHYFSLPDILASQERVPCVFKQTVGFLDGFDPRSESSVLDQGSSLEIPYWLAKVFTEDDVVAMDFPKVFTASYRDILKADANVVDLYKLSKYFYEFGKLLSYTQHRDALELCDTLIDTFIDRFRQLADWAQSTSNTSHFEMEDKLDCLERYILARGKAANTLLASWLTHGVGKIATAELVSVYKRRKLLAKEFNIESS